jgi:hypothetical protein
VDESHKATGIHFYGVASRNYQGSSPDVVIAIALIPVVDVQAIVGIEVTHNCHVGLAQTVFSSVIFPHRKATPVALLYCIRPRRKRRGKRKKHVVSRNGFAHSFDQIARQKIPANYSAYSRKRRSRTVVMDTLSLGDSIAGKTKNQKRNIQKNQHINDQLPQ